MLNPFHTRTQRALFLSRMPEDLIDAEAHYRDIPTTFSKLSKLIKDKITNYDRAITSPETAINEGKGSCIALALAFLAVAQARSDMRTGLMVVSNQFLGSMHCMAGLAENGSDGFSCIVDSVFLQQKDPATQEKLPCKTALTYNTSSFWQESVYGGMRSALALMDIAPLGDSITHTDISSTEPEWCNHDNGCKLEITGFFNGAIVDVCNYYTDGIESQASQAFIEAREMFKTEVQ